MKVRVRIFPVAGLCDHSQELELDLQEGSFGEALAHLEGRLGVNLAGSSGDNPGKQETFMFLLNGRALDMFKDTVLCDGDQLWLLPRLSGG